MAWKRLSGVRVPHRKQTAQMQAAPLPCPGSVCLPMGMHIGAPAKLVVAVGDAVKVGQLIAEAGGFVSAPVHASVSGTVKKIEEVRLAGGRVSQAVFLEADGLQTPHPDLAPPRLESTEDFLAAVRDSGLVGLGGAGFPTAVKLTVKDLRQIQTIIINGAECEPYITSDTRTMLDDAPLLAFGAQLLQTWLQVGDIVFAVERNKPACIAALRKALDGLSGVRVRDLPAMYPQGGEKVLIYHITGRMVPEGKLPLDVGAVVLNCTTLAALARFVQTGMPLVAKCVTVDGPAVREPKNVLVPIGTALEEVFAFCGGFRETPRKILYGGPVMGLAVAELTAPVLKNTNALVAFDEKHAAPREPEACIHCGRCMRGCPLHLMPMEIEAAYAAADAAMLGTLKVNLCMECGCCSYTCPAARPLTQTNRLSKAKLAAWKAAQSQKEGK